MQYRVRVAFSDSLSSSSLNYKNKRNGFCCPSRSVLYNSLHIIKEMWWRERCEYGKEERCYSGEFKRFMYALVFDFQLVLRKSVEAGRKGYIYVVREDAPCFGPVSTRFVQKVRKELSLQACL